MLARSFFSPKINFLGVKGGGKRGVKTCFLGFLHPKGGLGAQKKAKKMEKIFEKLSEKM